MSNFPEAASASLSVSAAAIFGSVNSSSVSPPFSFARRGFVPCLPNQHFDWIICGPVYLSLMLSTLFSSTSNERSTVHYSSYMQFYFRLYAQYWSVQLIFIFQMLVYILYLWENVFIYHCKYLQNFEIIPISLFDRRFI